MRDWSSLTDAFLDFHDVCDNLNNWLNANPGSLIQDWSDFDTGCGKTIKRNEYAMSKGIPSIFD